MMHGMAQARGPQRSPGLTPPPRYFSTAGVIVERNIPDSWALLCPPLASLAAGRFRECESQFFPNWVFPIHHSMTMIVDVSIKVRSERRASAWLFHLSRPLGRWLLTNLSLAPLKVACADAFNAQPLSTIGCGL